MGTDQVETLARVFAECLGRPIASTAEAADLLGISPSTLRSAVYSGEITGSRMAPNGPLRFATLELARFINEGESRSLPSPNARKGMRVGDR